MSQLSPTHRWLFLGIISLGLFMIGVDNSILYTALPTLRSELHTSEVLGLWIINAYPLVLAGLLLGTGTLGDKIGHRRMFEIGLIIFGLASLAAAFSPTPEFLIAARAALGVGAATMMPATLALLRLTFTDIRQRNTAIGIWGAVATLGAASGPVIGGLLLEHYWWGSVFLINVPVVIVALVATFALAPENIAQPDRHWDFLSSLWAMVAMVGVVVFIKEITNSGITSLLGMSIVLIVIGGFLFSRRQKLLPEPILSLDIFTNPVFSAGVLGAGVAMFVLAGSELMTTQRFQLSVGFSPLEAGLLTATAALAAFPTSILGGATLHRVGFRPLISGGFIVMAVGAAIAVWGAHAEAFSLFVAGMVALGAGGGLVMSVTSTAIIGSAPAKRAGMASAVEEVSYEFGTLLTVAVLGSLLPALYAYFAPAEVATDFDRGLHHPIYALEAHHAFDTAYMLVLGVAGTVAMVTALITAVLLAGNPKEPEYAHE